MTGREYLEPLPAETERLRGVKKQSAALFDDVSVVELRQAARWLRAAAFNAEDGARHLDHIANTRTETP